MKRKKVRLIPPTPLEVAKQRIRQRAGVSNQRVEVMLVRGGERPPSLRWARIPKAPKWKWDQDNPPVFVTKKTSGFKQQVIVVSVAWLASKAPELLAPFGAARALGIPFIILDKEQA